MKINYKSLLVGLAAAIVVLLTALATSTHISLVVGLTAVLAFIVGGFGVSLAEIHSVVDEASKDLAVVKGVVSSVTAVAAVPVATPTPVVVAAPMANQVAAGDPLDLLSQRIDGLRIEGYERTGDTFTPTPTVSDGGGRTAGSERVE